jgi:hypothetical protein
VITNIIFPNPQDILEIGAILRRDGNTHLQVENYSSGSLTTMVKGHTLNKE